MIRLFASKEKKKKHGLTIAPEPAKQSGKYGSRWIYPFCMRLSSKGCGGPWDGSVTRDPTR